MRWESARSRHNGSPTDTQAETKTEALAKAPSTIASRLEEEATLKKWPNPRLCYANGILETKTNDGSTVAKAPGPRTNPNTKETLTAPKRSKRIREMIFF
jgi:hypothetical protein